MTSYVVDASLMVRALLPTQRMPEAVELMLDAERHLAPPVLRQEFYNAVHRSVRRSLLALSVADEAVAQIEALPIEYVDSPAWLARALSVARRFDQPRIFDPIYYVCAEDLDTELWTCDRKFVASFGRSRPSWLRLCPDDLPGADGAR